MNKVLFLKCLNSYDTKTFLLLHMNGGNGSTTFSDSSMYARSVSASGNAAQSTTQIKFGASSAYFDGTGDGLTITGINIGTSAFCCECWARGSATERPMPTITYWHGAATRGAGFMMATNWDGSTNNKYMIYDASGRLISSTALASGSWNHLAVVGNGGANGSRTMKLYLNGTQVGSTATLDYNFTGKSLYIGYNSSESYYGYIDEVRISVGTERYTGNFTAPTAEFLM